MSKLVVIKHHGADRFLENEYRWEISADGEWRIMDLAQRLREKLDLSRAVILHPWSNRFLIEHACLTASVLEIEQKVHLMLPKEIAHHEPDMDRIFWLIQDKWGWGQTVILIIDSRLDGFLPWFCREQLGWSEDDCHFSPLTNCEAAILDTETGSMVRMKPSLRLESSVEQPMQC